MPPLCRQLRLSGLWRGWQLLIMLLLLPACVVHMLVNTGGVLLLLSVVALKEAAERLEQE